MKKPPWYGKNDPEKKRMFDWVIEQLAPEYQELGEYVSIIEQHGSKRAAEEEYEFGNSEPLLKLDPFLRGKLKKKKNPKKREGPLGYQDAYWAYGWSVTSEDYRARMAERYIESIKELWRREYANEFSGHNRPRGQPNATEIAAFHLGFPSAQALRAAMRKWGLKSKKS